VYVRFVYNYLLLLGHGVELTLLLTDKPRKESRETIINYLSSVKDWDKIFGHCHHVLIRTSLLSSSDL
jgi:RAB protein geranylgeranyltransferase component A